MLVLCWLGATSVRANVYATDIRLNGSLRHGVILPGTSVTISYILNETASAGVSVQILCGTNIIKTLNSTNGVAGTNAGFNTAVWDGSSDVAANLEECLYSVSITAASAGYGDWTNITDDSTNFSVNVPRGITVNQNTNSPYYGRVFVGNANSPFGIFKYNADGSPADEGGFSTGGVDWGAAVHYSPWKMTISGDDKVYIDDFSGGGLVYAFDQRISSNRVEAAIRPDNYPTQDATPQLSGLAVTGAGTNTQIWMADSSTNGSAGIIVWAATNGVAASNDTGTIVTPVDPSYVLSQGPYDISLDTNENIYAIQFITPLEPSGYPLMCFPPFQGEPETNTTWAVGYDDTTMLESYGLSVDPTATYVAVAVVGLGDGESKGYGALDLFSASNGILLTNLDQTGGDPYYDVAWDAVGNLYALDGFAQVWRAYSPPGTNQSTTVAVPFVQAYNALVPPLLCNPMMCDTNVRFTLAGQSNITYIVQSSPDLVTWTPVATNFSANANRCIFLPATNADQSFFQAVSAP